MFILTCIFGTYQLSAEMKIYPDFIQNCSEIDFDKDGNGWLTSSSNNEIIIFDGINKEILTIENEQNPVKGIYSMAIDSANNKWFASSSGIYKYDGTDWKLYEDDFLKRKQAKTGYRNTAMTVSFEGILWVACEKGIASLASDNWIYYTNEDMGISNGIVGSIEFDSHGQMWVATDKSIVKYKDDKWEVLNVNIPNTQISYLSQLAIDRKNNIWIVFSPIGPGVILAKYNGSSWSGWSTYEISSLGSIGQIAIDSSQNVWCDVYIPNEVQMDKHGIIRFDGINFNEIETKSGEKGMRRFGTISTNKNGQIWAAADTLVIFTGPFTSVDDPNEGSNLNLSSYPNPFNNQTTIEYTLDNAAFVAIDVFDVFGNKVAKLVNSRQSEGQHREVFDASQLSQGTYYYTIKVGSELRTGKLVLVK
jgi:type IX secretion system substrate protein